MRQTADGLLASTALYGCRSASYVSMASPLRVSPPSYADSAGAPEEPALGRHLTCTGRWLMR